MMPGVTGVRVTYVTGVEVTGGLWGLSQLVIWGTGVNRVTGVLIVWVNEVIVVTGVRVMDMSI